MPLRESYMSKTALFTNFSSEEFVCHWDGKPKKFSPGQSIYMPDYLAKHFAKHLANRELLRKGKERDTSPKIKVRADGTKYIENENFNEVFKKAYTPDETDDGLDTKEKRPDVDMLIDLANKNSQKKQAESKMSAKDKFHFPQIITTPESDDKEEGFEGNPVDNTK